MSNDPNKHDAVMADLKATIQKLGELAAPAPEPPELYIDLAAGKDQTMIHTLTPEQSQKLQAELGKSVTGHLSAAGPFLQQLKKGKPTIGKDLPILQKNVLIQSYAADLMALGPKLGTLGEVGHVEMVLADPSQITLKDLLKTPMSDALHTDDFAGPPFTQKNSNALSAGSVTPTGYDKQTPPDRHHHLEALTYTARKEALRRRLRWVIWHGAQKGLYPKGFWKTHPVTQEDIEINCALYAAKKTEWKSDDHWGIKGHGHVESALLLDAVSAADKDQLWVMGVSERMQLWKVLVLKFTPIETNGSWPWQYDAVQWVVGCDVYAPGFVQGLGTPRHHQTVAGAFGANTKYLFPPLPSLDDLRWGVAQGECVLSVEHAYLISTGTLEDGFDVYRMPLTRADLDEWGIRHAPLLHYPPKDSL